MSRQNFGRSVDQMENGNKLTLEQLFYLVAEYHDKLGYPKRNRLWRSVRDEANRVILALFAEIAELQESYPWKPWRPENYAQIDMDNIKVEIVDILFFLGSFMELFQIQPWEIEAEFKRKLKENYRRIERGYNKDQSVDR
jgi:NTP pyrophosphatase (non-canonical NTP hydrolase)